MQVIYADYAATTPLDPKVLEAMMPYLTDVYFNASSTHAGGMQAQQAVMKARMEIAKHIGAKMNEIVFTSGATEAINLAIIGCARKSENRKAIISVGTEHAAMLDATKYCADHGITVVYLGVDENGLVNMDELRHAVNDQTLIVSVMAVNNETGVMQDLKALSEIAHTAGALFMTDATQAYGKIALNVDDMGIDLMTFSGHKIYGPKGVGVLYRRNRKDVACDIEPMLYGGGQEGGVRSGTLNVPGIVGMATAGTLAYAQHAEESARVRALRDRFEHAIVDRCQARVNGAGAPRSYNISNVTFADADANAMILEMPQVACSKGSACSSAKPKPSHVLTGMGRTAEEADHSMRFSFGRFTTEADVDRLIDAVVTAHEKARALVT